MEEGHRKSKKNSNKKDMAKKEGKTTSKLTIISVID